MSDHEATAPLLGGALPHAARGETRVDTVLSPAERRRVLRYGVVGVLNVALDFFLYALLVSFGVWYLAAKALSLGVATFNGYTLNRVWTFEAGAASRVTASRYIGVQTGCFAANALLLALLVEVLHVAEIPAQCIAIPLVAATSFLGNRFWAFGAAVRRRDQAT